MDAAVAIIHMADQPPARSWQIIQDFIVHEHLDCAEDLNSYTLYVCGDESHVEKLVNCVMELDVKFSLFRKVEVVSLQHPPDN